MRRPQGVTLVTVAVASFLVIALAGALIGALSSHKRPAAHLALGVGASASGQAISTAAIQHWMQIGALQAGGSVPDAPSFSGCVATGRTQDLKQKSKGEAALTSAQLLTQCQEAYEALLGQALDVLVSYDWLSQAASREGLGVSEAAVREEYLSEAKAAFHTPQAFEAYLVKSGLSPADVMLRIRSQLLAAALQKRAEAQASVVTQAQVAAYVATHPPASKTWDVDVVLAHSEQVALKARSEILSGEPWARVAKALSVDPSAASGGLVKDLGAQEADTSLAKALEGSRPGVLVGPFHSDFGYYLIRVISVQGQRPPTLAQREVKARAALASSHESTAWQSFLTSWKAQHKAQTTCLAAYYDPQICGQEASG